MGDRSRGHVVRGRDWGKAAVGRPKLQEMDSKGMIHVVFSKHVPAVWGKADHRNGGQEHEIRGERAGVGQGSGREARAAREGQLRLGEMAVETYELRREKKTRGMGGRSRGHVVRGRAWGKGSDVWLGTTSRDTLTRR